MLSPTAQTRIIALAQRVLRTQRNDDGSGVSSSFYKVTETFGVKVKRCDGELYMRDTYQRQVEAYKMGLGPYCFGLQEYDVLVGYDFEGKPKFRKMWGYITQIVTIHYTLLGDTWYDEDVKEHKPFLHQLKHMQRRFTNALNWRFRDCHNHNIGITNRKILCIDFGDD